jgi:hypothetical protein
MFGIYFEFLAGIYASQGHKWVIIAKTLIRNTLLWRFWSGKPRVGTRRLDGTKERILALLNNRSSDSVFDRFNRVNFALTITIKKRPKRGVF